MGEAILAWHFTCDKLRDGSPIPPIGEWLEFTGAVEICKSGLHASRHPFDALEYAPGSILHRVECNKIVTDQWDKFVCRRRRIIASRDAEKMLRRFAKDQALSVADKWNPPDVVMRYLRGDDETLRAAARDAAWAVARDAAWAATRDAAWAATRGAARDAAWDAARDAAWDAAWGAVRAAARDEFSVRVKKLFSEGE